MEFVYVDARGATNTPEIRPFYIGRTEVSNGQFRRVRPTYESSQHGRDHIIDYQAFVKSLHPEFDTDDQPAVYVPWADANAFAEWLSERTEHNVRLPTEREWETACRAGTTSRFSWGDDESRAFRHANTNDPLTAELFKMAGPFPCDDAHRVTAPVGSFAPNPYGLFDMHGNAAEWTSDLWREPVLGPLADDGSEPGDPRKRVVKGGDFTCRPDGRAFFSCECAAKSWNYLGNSNFGTGFRIVIDAENLPP